MVLLSIGQGGGELGPAAVLVVGLDAFFGSPKEGWLLKATGIYTSPPLQTNITVSSVDSYSLCT